VKIEKDIPLPPKGRGSQDRRDLARTMDVGDSVLLETLADQENLRKRLYRLGRRSASRKQAGGWRVWRIE
jgi:hypothetical protein